MGKAAAKSKKCCEVFRVKPAAWKSRVGRSHDYAKRAVDLFFSEFCDNFNHPSFGWKSHAGKQKDQPACEPAKSRVECSNVNRPFLAGNRVGRL